MRRKELFQRIISFVGVLFLSASLVATPVFAETDSSGSNSSSSESGSDSSESSSSDSSSSSSSSSKSDSSSNSSSSSKSDSSSDSKTESKSENTADKGKQENTDSKSGDTEEKDTDSKSGDTEEKKTEQGDSDDTKDAADTGDGKASSETEASDETEVTDETEVSAETEVSEETEAVNETEVLSDETEKEEKSSSYNGIQIDDDFSDWDSVEKTHVNNGSINDVAMVFDGDYVYVYLSSPLNWEASHAGGWGNGKFAITTDTGNQMLFTMNIDGTISGVDGATIAHSDLTWGLDNYYYEIAIPVDQLPAYQQTISFGEYLGETYVENVANYQESSSTEDKKPGAITNDGSYDDWTYYPMTTIEYATGGTQENVVDAKGSLYSNDGKLYGYVESTMPAHMASGGKHFTEGITININDQYNFYPRVVAIDSNGNINWNPQRENLSNGTYEFYMVDNQGWSSASNVSDWNDDSKPWEKDTNAVYGKMILTVGPSSTQMEYEMDIETLTKKFGLNASEAQKLSAQYIDIGNQWVQTAGTSTGTWVGIVLCLAVVGCTYLRRRYKEGYLV